MTQSFDSVPLLPDRTIVGANYPYFVNKPGLWFGPVKEKKSPPGGSDIPQYLLIPGGCSAGGAETETEEFRNAWRNSFPRLLAKYKKAGIRLVRVFLMSNACNYGFSQGSSFQIPAASDIDWNQSYAKHLDELLSMCRSADMPVILVLLSYAAFAANWREKLASDHTLRDAFFDRVFEPMLTVSDRYPDVAWGWEPVNEPNWPVNYWLSMMLAPLGAWNCTPGTSQSDMQAFLDAATARIQNHKLSSGRRHPVTHGFSYGPACEIGIAPLGLPVGTSVNVSDEKLFSVSAAGANYQRQFHYYPAAAPSAPARVDLRNDLPTCKASGYAMLGEFSTAKPDWSKFRSTHDPQYLSWSRLGGRDAGGDYEATFFRLVLCNQQGFGIALLWPNQDHTESNDSGFSATALLGATDFLNAPVLPAI